MARTDEILEEVLGTYIQTIWAVGRDWLINGLNHYLNFGFTSGSLGYGIRDNNGVMESKNSGGAWAPFGAGTGGSGGGVVGLTDTGDHQNFTLSGAAPSTNYLLLANNAIYSTDDTALPFSVTGTTLTFTNGPIPTQLAATLMKLICV